MKRLLLVSICALSAVLSPVGSLVGGGVFGASDAAAYQTPVGNMPLVVIRFNQRSVYYEQQLYNAVSRAVEIKPSVRFELVSYMPHTGNPDADQRLANQATTNLQRVANSFIEMGVPRQRLTITSEPRRNMRYDEVHVFVQ